MLDEATRDLNEVQRLLDRLGHQTVQPTVHEPRPPDIGLGLGL